MKKNTTLALFILFLFLAGSCKKDALTKATQKGANTFSCKINGSVFKPCKNKFISDPELYGGLSVGTITIARINANCYNNFPKKTVGIELSDFNGEGEYFFTDQNNRGVYIEYNATLPLVMSYESLYTAKGKVTITKDDRVNAILSGTFEFTATNKDNPNDIVEITDGRFDINYKK